jgi:asparagine synthase (glutamine-hydrolysing)
VVRNFKNKIYAILYLMCSFLILNYILKNYELANKYQKPRGPDLTNDLFYNNFTFVHNLLNVTGNATKQPFINEENKIIAIFNGEIYNYKNFGDYSSDGFCLIDLYLKYGNDFIKYLDGEFAIVLVDFKNNKIIISTDVFGTKPLWYGIDSKRIGISSYKSALESENIKNIKYLNPNTTKIYNLITLQDISEERVYCFDFKQYKNSYDDYINALIESLKKRTNTDSLISVGLSSGYDSGVICCLLNNLNINYRTYTINGKENMKVLSERIHKNDSNFFSIDLQLEQINEEYSFLKENCEKYNYQHQNGIGILDDMASIGLSVITNKAKEDGVKIVLSGSGADEILCDYAKDGKKIMNHSCFSGIFPDDLSDILDNDPSKDMIWKSFYHGTMRDYLMKDEIISGLHGIEGRYPFLDKNVVQEFLNLSKELKNKYKGPLEEIFNRYDYPFEHKKIGFNITKEKTKFDKKGNVCIVENPVPNIPPKYLKMNSKILMRKKI